MSNNHEVEYRSGYTKTTDNTASMNREKIKDATNRHIRRHPKNESSIFDNIEMI